eukprot:765436-Hanusia_phi.AAC.2
MPCPDMSAVAASHVLLASYRCPNKKLPTTAYPTKTMKKRTRKCKRSMAARPIVRVTIPIRSWKSIDFNKRRMKRTTLTPANTECTLRAAPILCTLLRKSRNSSSPCGDRGLEESLPPGSVGELGAVKEDGIVGFDLQDPHGLKEEDPIDPVEGIEQIVSQCKPPDVLKDIIDLHHAVGKQGRHNEHHEKHCERLWIQDQIYVEAVKHVIPGNIAAFVPFEDDLAVTEHPMLGAVSDQLNRNVLCLQVDELSVLSKGDHLLGLFLCQPFIEEELEGVPAAVKNLLRSLLYGPAAVLARLCFRQRSVQVGVEAVLVVLVGIESLWVRQSFHTVAVFQHVPLARRVEGFRR